MAARIKILQSGMQVNLYLGNKRKASFEMLTQTFRGNPKYFSKLAAKMRSWGHDVPIRATRIVEKW